MDTPKQLSAEQVAQRRKRSIAIALVLAGLVVVFFVTTVVRLSSNLAAG